MAHTVYVLIKHGASLGLRNWDDKMCYEMVQNSAGGRVKHTMDGVDLVDFLLPYCDDQQVQQAGKIGRLRGIAHDCDRPPLGHGGTGIIAQFDFVKGQPRPSFQIVGAGRGVAWGV